MARGVALSVHLIAAVSAELACEAHPDCASCTSDPPCGWCSGRHFRLEDETRNEENRGLEELTRRRFSRASALASQHPNSL